MLKINLETLPEYGADLSGEVEEDIFRLPEHDATPAGPLEYDLHVQRFDDELLLQGRLSAPFNMICTGCLKEYHYDLTLENAAISVEIDSGEMDVTEAVREEMLFQFPAHPRCTDSEENEVCEIDPRYLAVDKSPGGDVDPAPAREESSKWSALDAFQPDSDSESTSDT